MESEQYQKGYEVGYENGYDEGYEAGLKSYREAEEGPQASNIVIADNELVASFPYLTLGQRTRVMRDMNGQIIGAIRV